MKRKNKKKHSKNEVSIPNFKIDKIDITANSGFFLLAQLVKNMNFIEKSANLVIYARKKIGEYIHILVFVINQFTGGKALQDTLNVQADGALKAIFGDIHIPTPHTWGDFLERFTEETTEKLKLFLKCKISI